MWPQSSSNALSLSRSSEIILTHQLTGRSFRLRQWRRNETLTKCVPTQNHSMDICPLYTLRAQNTQSAPLPQHQSVPVQDVSFQAKLPPAEENPPSPTASQLASSSKASYDEQYRLELNFAWNHKAIIIKRSLKRYDMRSWHSPGIK